jgi:hypothetical protein
MTGLLPLLQPIALAADLYDVCVVQAEIDEMHEQLHRFHRDFSVCVMASLDVRLQY